MHHNFYSLIRAQGSLRNSPLTDATKYPIILNAKDPIVRMMIESAHRRCMHHGTEYIRNYLQQNFVILGLRKTLRQIRHNCYLCRRFQGKGLHPLMADLSPTRFDDPSDDPFPFKNTGSDYIRPFYIATKDTTEKAIFASSHASLLARFTWNRQTTLLRTTV